MPVVNRNTESVIASNYTINDYRFAKKYGVKIELEDGIGYLYNGQIYMQRVD